MYQFLLQSLEEVTVGQMLRCECICISFTLFFHLGNVGICSIKCCFYAHLLFLNWNRGAQGESSFLSPQSELLEYV